MTQNVIEFVVKQFSVTLSVCFSLYLSINSNLKAN